MTTTSRWFQAIPSKQVPYSPHIEDEIRPRRGQNLLRDLTEAATSGELCQSLVGLRGNKTLVCTGLPNVVCNCWHSRAVVMFCQNYRSVIHHRWIDYRIIVSFYLITMQLCTRGFLMMLWSLPELSSVTQSILVDNYQLDLTRNDIIVNLLIDFWSIDRILHKNYSDHDEHDRRPLFANCSIIDKY